MYSSCLTCSLPSARCTRSTSLMLPSGSMLLAASTSCQSSPLSPPCSNGCASGSPKSQGPGTRASPILIPRQRSHGMAMGWLLRLQNVRLLACHLERGLSFNHTFEDGGLELSCHLSPFSVDKCLPLALVQLRPRGIVVRKMADTLKLREVWPSDGAALDWPCCLASAVDAASAVGTGCSALSIHKFVA